MTPTRDYWQGLRDGTPFILVIVPFGIVFGVVATEAGLNLAEVMGFSILVLAGAAQIVAVQMILDQTPTLIVLAASLAVNLRLAMYSASLAPHLGPLGWWRRSLVAYLLVDQAYAAASLRYDTIPDLTLGQKFAYFIGVSTPIVPLWYLATWGGAVLGTAIPPGLPIDFAVPITFLALIVPMLRSLPHVVAAMVSIISVLVLSFLPYNLGLLVAALLAMMAGAETERRLTAKGTKT